MMGVLQDLIRGVSEDVEKRRAGAGKSKHREGKSREGPEQPKPMSTKGGVVFAGPPPRQKSGARQVLARLPWISRVPVSLDRAVVDMHASAAGPGPVRVGGAR